MNNKEVIRDPEKSPSLFPHPTKDTLPKTVVCLIPPTNSWQSTTAHASQTSLWQCRADLDRLNFARFTQQIRLADFSLNSDFS